MQYVNLPLILILQNKAPASAQEASQNFKNTQEELSSLDSRYQANQKRITELNALKSNGTISASGKSELEMLEKENIALKTQINSKNTLQDMEQQKETGIYRKSISSDRYLSLFNRDSWLIRVPKGCLPGWIPEFSYTSTFRRPNPCSSMQSQL